MKFTIEHSILITNDHSDQPKSYPYFEHWEPSFSLNGPNLANSVWLKYHKPGAGCWGLVYSKLGCCLHTNFNTKTNRL